VTTGETNDEARETLADAVHAAHHGKWCLMPQRCPEAGQIADALIAEGYEKPETVFVCSPDGSGGHEMNAAALALIMANNTIERLTRELAESRREPEPREVTTVEELDALPEGIVILSEVGGVWERWLDGIGAVWRETGSSAKHYASDIALPARILFTPSTEEAP